MRYYLIVLLLAGCANTDMVKVAEPTNVAVYWFRVKPVCGLAEPGCTSTVDIAPDFSMCRITALESVTDAILGHEFRRCFGYVRGANYRHPWHAHSDARYDGRDMVKIAEPKSVIVTWRRETPTKATCHNPRWSPQRVPEGCAAVAANHSVCRIIAHEWADDNILGHELRHCFGWKHAADAKAWEERRRAAQERGGR